MNTAPVNATVELLYSKTTNTTAHRHSWYLDIKQIRPKKQYRWTLKERTVLYKLRVVENKSIPEIQKYFRKLNNIPIYLGVDEDSDKFSRTRIHNQIRMIRGAFNGLCHKCRSPLTKSDLRRINRKKKEDPSLGLCLSCFHETSAYKINKRKKALKEGICPICNEKEVLPGHASCKECLSASHRYRYANGLCGKCGKHPLAENSVAFCKSCLEENKKSSREYRKKARKLLYSEIA